MRFALPRKHPRPGAAPRGPAAAPPTPVDADGPGDSGDGDGDGDGRAPAEPAAAVSLLRERIYATLTGLSTVLILLTNAATTSAGSAATSLAVTMGGLFAAALVADLVAHSAVHRDAPDRYQWRQITAVAAQAVETAIIPVLAVGLAGTGIWTVRTGLLIAATVLVLSLVAIATWAVLRMKISVRKRVLIVGGEALLGALVIGIKLIDH